MNLEFGASIIAFLFSLIWMGSCAVRTPEHNEDEIEERVAEVEVSDRRPNGQFDTPNTSPFGGVPVIKKRWQYEDANGRTFFGGKMKVGKKKDKN